VHPVGYYCANSLVEDSGLLGSNIASYDATSTHKKNFNRKVTEACKAMTTVHS